MCLNPTHSKVKIAEKDIIVYKRLKIQGNRLLSPYTFFEYKLNKEYTVKTKLSDKTLREVNRGLHAYQTEQKAKDTKYPSDAIYIAKIPRGAIYKLGTNDDIVSNKLKVIKKCA